MMNPNEITELNGTKISGRLLSVYEMIPEGAANPTPSKLICATLHVTPRHLAEMVNTLLYQYHIPVVAYRKKGRHGYAIATNQQELDDGCAPLESTCHELNQRINTLKSFTFQEEG